MHRIGIIGAGDYGAQHANAIKELDNGRLVAASRTNAAALAQFVDKYHIRDYTDYHELLGAADIDVVVIATPHHLHTPIVEAAAQSRKHILLEKPMAPSLSECDRILRAVETANVKLMLGHVNRFARPYQVAKEMIASGEMGNVVLGMATMQKYWLEANRRDWHLQRETGGGVWLTVGIHPLDRLTWLINSTVYSVSAQFGTYFHQQDADDAGMVFLRYENGAAGTIVSTGYSVGAPKHLTELTCTRGMLNIDYSAGVQIGRNDEWQTIPESVPDCNWMHEALVNEWRAFLYALDSDTEPVVSGTEARHTMAVAFAAEESSVQRREILVSEVEGGGKLPHA